MSAARWHIRDGGLVTFARNVLTRYALIIVNALISLVVLPYNLRHLGESAYGLWMVTAAITTYFSVLELGYGGAIVKFVAEYRARRDARGLNEILSTMFYVFCAIGALVGVAAVVVSFLLPHIFNLEPGQETTAQIIFLIIASNVAVYFPFSVFGGVINGFERYWLNNVVGTAFNIATALVNVLVLWLGYGLIELVAATTAMRMLPYLVYRRNAYAVFPELQIRREFFRRDRLRDVTGFSIYFAVIDWSTRLTYAADLLILGMFLNTAVVAVYAVAQRLSEALLRMTNQLHTFLFPAVVYRAVADGIEGQQQLMVKATRFQLAIAVALCGSVAAIGDVLLHAWVGRELSPFSIDASAEVLRVLAAVVVLRTFIAMPSTMLKGTGHHKQLAFASAWCALASLLLSVAGVKLFGMQGVAWAMLLPAAVLSMAIVFPRCCRLVGLGVMEGYRRVVWPATWPALVVITLLAATRHAVTPRLTVVFVLLALGGLAYAALFFLFGLDREERQWFTTAIGHVWRRSSQGLATA